VEHGQLVLQLLFVRRLLLLQLLLHHAHATGRQNSSDCDR
jgi:hypothetical protein